MGKHVTDSLPGYRLLHEGAGTQVPGDPPLADQAYTGNVQGGDDPYLQSVPGAPPQAQDRPSTDASVRGNTINSQRQPRAKTPPVKNWQSS